LLVVRRRSRSPFAVEIGDGETAADFGLSEAARRVRRQLREIFALL